MRPIAISALVISALLATSSPSLGHTTTAPVIASGRSPLPSSCSSGRNRSVEAEPSLAVNPRNPHNILTAWMQDLSDDDSPRAIVAGRSSDGGRTWKKTVVAGRSACRGGDVQFVFDAWLSFGVEGRAYLASSSGTVAVNTSTDNGAHWSRPVRVAPELGLLQDKPEITADPAAVGTAYIVWTQERGDVPFPLSFVPGGVLRFSKTADGGKTWSPSVGMYAPPGGLPIGGNILVLPDGTLVCVFTELHFAKYVTAFTHVPPVVTGGGDAILAVRSTDGGKTWSAPVKIADQGDPIWQPPQDPETGDVNQGLFVSAASGGGRAYVVWSAPTIEGDSSVLWSSSRDGSRWTAPAVVPTKGSAFLPAIATDGDGTVAVTYYDTRNDVPGDDELSTDVWFTHRHRGGKWQEQHLSGPFDLREVPDRFLGDYHGLVAWTSGFVATFVQTTPVARGGPTDVLFARATAG